MRVFENRVLRRIFGPKGKELEGGWKRLHNEEVHIRNLYASPNTYFVWVMKRRSVSCTGHTSHMGEMRST
jgi:hypothetical protein